MKSYLFAPSFQLGLDIQADKIRLILLHKTRQGFFLERSDVIDLPNDIAEKKTRYWEEVTDALSKYAARFKLKGIPTAVSLPANSVMIQHMPLPKDLSHETIEAEICEKLERDLRGKPDALCIDYQITPASKSGKLFFIVAKQAFVSRYVDCIEEAGLALKIIDVDIFSLKRALCFALNWQKNPERIYAIVSAQEEMAALTLFTGEEMLFYQTWNISYAADFLLQLKNKIQQYEAAGGAPLHELSVYATEDYYQPISKEAIFASCNLQHLDPTSVSLPLPHTKTKCLERISSEFFIACGTALREFPEW